MQATLAPIFNELQTNGVKSLNGIADELNRRSAPTPRPLAYSAGRMNVEADARVSRGFAYHRASSQQPAGYQKSSGGN